MANPLLVMKFGGTSVGSHEAIVRCADRIVEEARKRHVAVIVSAMAGVTDCLLDALSAGSEGDETVLDAELGRLLAKHRETCEALLPASRHAAVRERIETIFEDFGRIARGMLLLKERPPKSVDQAAPTGERLSALLLSEVLQAKGIPAVLVSGTDVIVTNAIHGGAEPYLDETTSRAEAVLRPLLDDGSVPVLTGYNAATRHGTPTTLGRGGSDFSAAIVASALRADELWIWTDVDGILSCDPSIDPQAKLLTDVTYNEAAELAYNGAKVLHPRTLAPLAELGIPVRIRNSFDPGQPGTRISVEAVSEPGVRAITSLDDVALVSIEAVSASMSGAQLMARALEAAARAKVEVLVMTRSSFRQNFCMLVHGRDVDPALAALREELALELAHEYLRPIDIDHSVGLLAAVGEGMRGTPGLAGRLFTAISRQSVNIIAIAQGSSELTIAIVVSQGDLRTAVSAIHRECGLGLPAKAPA